MGKICNRQKMQKKLKNTFPNIIIIMQNIQNKIGLIWKGILWNEKCTGICEVKEAPEKIMHLHLLPCPDYDTIKSYYRYLHQYRQQKAMNFSANL